MMVLVYSHAVHNACLFTLTLKIQFWTLKMFLNGMFYLLFDIFIRFFLFWAPWALAIWFGHIQWRHYVESPTIHWKGIRSLTTRHSEIHKGTSCPPPSVLHMLGGVECCNAIWFMIFRSFLVRFLVRFCVCICCDFFVLLKLIYDIQNFLCDIFLFVFGKLSGFCAWIPSLTLSLSPPFGGTPYIQLPRKVGQVFISFMAEYVLFTFFPGEGEYLPSPNCRPKRIPDPPTDHLGGALLTFARFRGSLFLNFTISVEFTSLHNWRIAFSPFSARIFCTEIDFPLDFSRRWGEQCPFLQKLCFFSDPSPLDKTYDKAQPYEYGWDDTPPYMDPPIGDPKAESIFWPFFEIVVIFDGKNPPV